MVEPGTGPGTDIVEIPLIGEEPAELDGHHSEPEPNWRRAVGIALVGGTVIGIGIAALVLSSDGEPDADTSSTAPSDEPADRITTPPTLAPLDTLPRPDVTTAPAFDDSPQETTSQDRTLFDQAQRPQYPGVPDVPLSELVQYDVSGAVAQLADDRPRRSETHLELGTAGYTLDVAITRDPERDRYRIVVEARGLTQVAIVDNATDTTYIDPGTDNSQTVPNAEIIAGSTATSVNEYFDRLLLGPIRPETINAAATRGRGLVAIDGVGVAREFVSVVAGDLVPEWQLYAFSPVFEFPVEDRPSSLEYGVYVDEQGRVVQVDGVALVGNVPQLVQHRLFHLDDGLAVDLPESSTTASSAVPSTSATTAPSTVPPNTTE